MKYEILYEVLHGYQKSVENRVASSMLIVQTVSLYRKGRNSPWLKVIPVSPSERPPIHSLLNPFFYKIVSVIFSSKTTLILI